MQTDNYIEDRENDEIQSPFLESHVNFKYPENIGEG